MVEAHHLLKMVSQAGPVIEERGLEIAFRHLG
jgi:hypothetical protein